MEVLGPEVGDDGDARGDEGGHGLDALPRRLVLVRDRVGVRVRVTVRVSSSAPACAAA